MKRSLGAILLWGLVFVAGAAAQTYTPPVASDYQATINATGAIPTSSNISSNLPGYVDDQPALQAMSGNSVAQLQSAGATAQSTNVMTPIIQSNNTYKPNNVISANTAWVQNALGIQEDPDSTAGSTAGTGTQACTTTQPSITSHSTYTCETGVVVTTGPQTCTLEYQPTYQNTYVYICHASWVDGQAGLVPDPRCTILAPQATCTLESSSCTTPATTGTASYQCFVGNQYTPSTATCSTSTTSQYTYQCNADWVQGQAGLVPDARCSAVESSGICTQTGATCVTPGVNDTQTYSCFAGTQYSSGTNTCHVTHGVTQTGGNYNYTCHRDEYLTNNATYLNQHSGVAAYKYKHTCTFISGSSGLDAGQGCGYFVSTIGIGDRCGPPVQSSGNSYEIYCTAAYTGINNVTYQGTATDNCDPYVNSAACTVNSSVCNSTWGTTCNDRQMSVSCTSSTGTLTPDSMNPTFTDNGVDSSACSSYAGGSNCSITASTCVSQMDPIAAAALGLPVGTCADTSNTYTCTGSTPVNYCNGSAPTASGYTCTPSTVCHASGSDPCAITETVNTCTKVTGVNGCESEQRTYACTGEVANANPPLDVVDSTNSALCQSLASNSSCQVTNQVCNHWTTRYTRGPHGIPIKQTVCDGYDYTYTCDGYSPVNYCNGSAPTGNGWTCTPTQTCQASGNNACAITKTDYACSRSEGVNGCKDETRQYACSTDITPADPYQQLRQAQTGGTYAYNPACSAANNNLCTLDAKTCNDSGGTRVINGVTVTSACFAYTESYTCDTPGGTQTTCAPQSGCTLQTQNCLSDPSSPISSCTTVENVYDCVSSTPGQPTTSCTTSYNNTQTITAQDDPDNNFVQAMSAINTAKESSTSYGSAADLHIFNGTDLRCKKAIFGLYNCCKDSGILLGNLVNCSADEKNLYAQQQNKSCHYIGTYCSKKSLFGTCLEKKMTYCCYGSVLARIVEDAGHTQLGKAWGDAKNPSCGGFSIAEFQQLDLTAVDFSEFYADKMATLSSGNPSSTVAAITANLNTMVANKSTHP